MSAKQWLKEQFEYEYCEECGGDAQHHAVASVMGNPFAYCLYPPSTETNYEFHPVIVAFRRRKDLRKGVTA